MIILRKKHKVKKNNQPPIGSFRSDNPGKVTGRHLASVTL
nr:MAG TPA: hypothetical protein [Caudoviricetes sp.]